MVLTSAQADPLHSQVKLLKKALATLRDEAEQLRLRGWPELAAESLRKASRIERKLKEVTF